MTKRSKLFVLLLLSALTCAAQTTTPNELVINTPDTSDGGFTPRRMIVARDGGFLTAGSDGLSGFLSKTSGCGQVLWTKKYLFGDETDLNSVAELPSGDIVAVGACRNCAPADSAQKALVIKTDPQGILAGDTMLGYAKFDAQANDVTITGAGKIAAVVNADFNGFLTPSDAVLVVLTDQLQPDIWKPLNHFYVDHGAALTQLSDGGFVLAGYSVPAFLAPTQAQLFRTDAAGNQLWKYTSPHLSGRFRDVVQAADGRIVALGDRQVDALVKREVFLAVFDQLNGALQLEKTYGSPADDAGLSLERVEGGYLAGAIYGQPRQQDWNWRAWVFRLDDQFEPVDNYFRDGYLFGHDLVNVLPLSSDGRAFAFHSIVHFFSSYYIQFFKRTFAGDRAVLAHAPLNNQLVPRNRSTNLGTVAFNGSVTDPGTYDEIRLDIRRNDAPFLSLTDDSPAAFDFAPAIPAELAAYSFRLYGVKDQRAHLEAEACDVVAGDAYLIQGQSNAVAGLPIWDLEDTVDHAYRHHATPWVRNFGLRYDDDTLYTWRKETGTIVDYADNISGQWGLVLGKNIVDTYGVPVAILNGAISGIPIDSMMPEPGNPDSRYGRFVRRVERSGLRDHLRAILMFQGETNAGAAFYDSANKYYQKFVTLDNAWKQDFPALEQRYLFQIRPGAYWIGATLLTCLQISEAQRRIAETLPGWQIMSSTGMNHDSTHYYYPNGYERAGHDIFRLVARDLYGAAPAANIHPPAVESLRFSHCNRKQITLRLRHTADTYAWTPGWEGDFRLEGATNVKVTSGQVSGSTVVLDLSAAPGAGFTGLSYTAHPGKDQAPVKNANGIGMLTFFNLPAAPYDLSAGASAAAAQCFGAADGSATALASGGSGTYGYQWSNGVSGATAMNLIAGTYTVTVSDANGCTATAAATVAQPPLPTGSLALTTCTGDSVLIGGQHYISPGQYQLTLTAASGCDSVLNVALSAFPTPHSADTVRLCAGETITLPGGTVVGQAGDFVLTLTSAVGCDSIVALRVDVASPIFLNDTTIVADNGPGNGLLGVTPGGGNPPYAYAWNTGAASGTITGLATGTYTVTVSDAQGCMQVFVLSVPMGVGTSAFVYPEMQVFMYPNPCGDYLELAIPEWPAKVALQIRISDAAGREMMPLLAPAGEITRIGTRDLPAGRFVVRVYAGGALRWSGVAVRL